MSAPATAEGYLLQLARGSGLVGEAQVVAAKIRLTAREADADSPGEVYRELIQGGELDESRVMTRLGETLGMRAIDLDGVAVPGAVLALVPRAQAEHYRLVPVGREGAVLRVAVADPLATDGPDALAQSLGLRVETRLASPLSIERAIQRWYGSERKDDALLAGTAGIEPAPEPETPLATRVEDDAPIIQLVQDIITRAVACRASDIHLEPLAQEYRVRYRVDGVLLPVESPPKRLQASIGSRLKIMAGISIAEKRLPQDGRIRVTVDGRELDLRVSSLPTTHGESIVMRILDQESLRIGLPELGFLPDDQAAFERLIALPDGILLVTGPTGSGKTTTLYGCLHSINHPDRKIITVEDPVEYQLAGVNQVPVRPEVGMTFSAALRAMLRQAPNIIMVGEIRDRETAEIAINASLTGHLVFSTLHTNDAPGAITRLVDIGVKPYLVSTALRGIMAQRLVRKICPACAEPCHPAPAELQQLGLTPAAAQGANFRRGRGCAGCRGTGYRGRTGIFEILTMDDELSQMIHAGAGTARLREKARAAGMRTLREDGARKVTAGLTTAEEVIAITVGDEN